jgi:hypothetical protein
METVTEMSSEDMHKAEVFSEGMERMKEEGIREEMSRTTKTGKTKMMGHCKEAIRNKSQLRGSRI